MSSRTPIRTGDFGEVPWRWVVVLALVVYAFPQGVHSARVVAEKRECATCHIAWITDFKRKDSVTLIPYEPRPLEWTGRQDVVSTERMCFSCHDGFVLDSRPLWLNERHNHPVGVVPSEKVHIPMRDDKTVFPLNDDGKVYCGTCHSAHGLSWQEKRSPIFLRVPNVDSSICVECHENRAKGEGGLNHPVFRKLDEVPNRLTAAGGMLGENDEIICQSCHTPHAARGKPLLVIDNSRAGLCRNCHGDKARVTDTKHDLSVSSPDLQNRKGESVGEFGPCLACHVIHEADGSAPLWGRETLSGDDPVRALCRSCHDDDGPASGKVIRDHSHPTNVSIGNLEISVTEDGWKTELSIAEGDEPPKPLPLFDSDGHRDPQGTNVTCLTCHDPHSWSAGDPQGDEPRNEEGDGNTSFLRIAQHEDSALCSNCHVDKRSVKLSKHNLAIFGPDARAELVRSAAMDRQPDIGVCGSCHRAHNGEGALMATATAAPGEAVIQSICTTCHAKKGIAAKKLTGEHSHPLERSLAELGWITYLPLFDPLGERDPAGVMDCATCHNPHQWDPADANSRAGARTDVEGTAQNSFLREAAAPSPLLCMNCHQDKRWIVNTDHDLNVTAPGAKNTLGQTPKDSGACGQCHSVHNAQQRLALWARNAKDISGPQESLCLSCHSIGRIAANKAPTKILHPQQIVVWSNTARALPSRQSELPVTPVFDHAGKPATAGRIACASCHNPHRWNPNTQAQGKGINQEGDATNSFLRNPLSGRLVCADCHGRDAIFRYKYFHGLTSRRSHPLYR